MGVGRLGHELRGGVELLDRRRAEPGGRAEHGALDLGDLGVKQVSTSTSCASAVFFKSSRLTQSWVILDIVLDLCFMPSLRRRRRTRRCQEGSDAAFAISNHWIIYLMDHTGCIDL